MAGVRYASGEEERAGRLVIAADGALVAGPARDAAGRSAWRADGRVVVQAAQDRMTAATRLRGSVAPGRMVVLIDRDDYWQAAFLIPKGEEGDSPRKRASDWLASEVAKAFPDFGLRRRIS